MDRGGPVEQDSCSSNSPFNMAPTQGVESFLRPNRLYKSPKRKQVRTMQC